MLGVFRSKVMSFLSSTDSKGKNLPVISAIASGLCPIMYYYNSNFTLINSWSQFSFFVFSFLCIPIVVFSCANLINNRTTFLKAYSKYLLAVLNFCFFTFLLVYSIYGFKKKILAFAIILAFILGICFYKYLRKIIVFQYLLAFIMLVNFSQSLYGYLTYSSLWQEQPDTIESVVFKKKPNIYLIQPDGYANFSELKGRNYNFDNTDFETFLTNNSFKLYDGFRSNYYSTLSSNSSLFTMKHHYYYNARSYKNELYNSREIIAGKNPVISVFKNNNYKTFLLLEHPYLLVNRPEIGYDYCNIDYKELSFLSKGFDIDRDLVDDLETVINDQNNKEGNFYFIEKIAPGHVAVFDSTNSKKEEERIKYLNKLKEANIWLKEIIQLILNKDNNCVIIIAADHGGFVGFNSTSEVKTKVTNKDLVNSIFTSALAIKWPNLPPTYQTELKTPVNLFRILFSYLSEEDVYLEYLQDDKSFIPIKEKETVSVYEYINEKGETVFNKKENK